MGFTIRTRAAGLGLACGLVAAGVARAATWAVPAAAPTIQAGIDSAAVGDTVLVAPGTYSGPGNHDIAFRGKDIVVRSAAGPAATVLDIQATLATPRRGFFIGDQETRAAVLDGFTIANGYMGTFPERGRGSAPGLPRIAHDLSGGGIKCQNSRPTLRNLVIRNCGSEQTGGGLDIELLAEPHVSNCVIQSCYAGFSGGGVTIETVSNPTLENCVITGNSAPWGGGIGCNASGTIRNSLIVGNAAADPSGVLTTLYGGGIAVTFPSRLVLERTIVADNCGPDGAGEIFADDQAVVSFACSILDPANIVRFGTGDVTYPSPNGFGRPAFCFPLGCDRAPIAGGDYHLQTGSLGLAGNSPCGMDVGPLGQGCIAQSRVQATSWSRLKSLYRE